MALMLKIPFRSVRFDTEMYAFPIYLSKWLVVSCVMNGLRNSVRKSVRGAIAIAHHRDDSVETVLLNLIRGTGISGLTGIHPVNGYIVRPLLCLSRKDIESYLSLRELPYVTDRTNKEDIYVRNKIRLQVLPLLESINPSVYETIERTASNLYETEQLYRSAISSFIDKITEQKDDELYIDISKLLDSPAPRTLLFEILKPFGFLPIQLNEVLKMASGISGKYILSGTHIFC